MAEPYGEIRDSRLLAIEWEGPHARLRLDLHLHLPTADGLGETVGVQHAGLVVENAQLLEAPEGAFLWIRGGHVVVGTRRIEGTVPLQLDESGPVELELTGLEGVLRATGTRVRLEPMGPVVTVEEIRSE